MSKTLLNHSTVTETLLHEAGETGFEADTLHSLVCELKPLLQLAERELLSPRPEAVLQLLSRALR